MYVSEILIFYLIILQNKKRKQIKIIKIEN